MQPRAYSTGYRHMLRFYTLGLWELVASEGYAFVMRMDEDSLIWSPIEYNLFEFMEQYDIGYAFRVDAFEGCCEVGYRRAVLDAFLKAKPDVKPTFMHSCCTTNNSALTHNMYGRCSLLEPSCQLCSLFSGLSSSASF